MDDMIFNLNRNLLLNGNTAKLISERSKLTINAINLTLDNSSTISSYEDMTLTIKNSLLNTNKSLIHTQSGNIVMKLQELKNHNASIIQSGSELIINGKLIENVIKKRIQKIMENHFIMIYVYIQLVAEELLKGMAMAGFSKSNQQLLLKNMKIQAKEQNLVLQILHIEVCFMYY